jgi:hypothetical protein
MGLRFLKLAISVSEDPLSFPSEIDFLNMKSTEKIKPESLKEFFSLTKTANYITIDSEHLLSVSEKNLHRNILSEEVAPGYDIASIPVCPPFTSQWIEISSRGRDSQTPSLMVHGYVVTILGMMVNESSPGVYDIFTLEDREINGAHLKKFNVARNVPGTDIGNTHLQMFFAVWMRAINSGALGVETGEDFIFLPKENSKKKNKKSPHHIRRIVRIVPKKLRDSITPTMSRGQIDFSHRWEVRGHWRRVSGIGKDRNGDYLIRGLTWVMDCVKGPEEKPVIKKIRWVPGQERAG